MICPLVQVGCLKSHTIIVLLLIFPFNSVSVCPGEGNGTPLQYSCLENPMVGGAWWAAVHGVAKSRTWLSNFTFHFHALEKEMATHSSVLAWRIQGTGETYGMLSLGSHRVRQDWSDLAAAAAVFALYIVIFLCLVNKYVQLLCLLLGVIPWSICCVLLCLIIYIHF